MNHTKEDHTLREIPSKDNYDAYRDAFYYTAMNGTRQTVIPSKAIIRLLSSEKFKQFHLIAPGDTVRSPWFPVVVPKISDTNLWLVLYSSTQAIDRIALQPPESIASLDQDPDIDILSPFGQGLKVILISTSPSEVQKYNNIGVMPILLPGKSGIFINHEQISIVTEQTTYEEVKMVQASFYLRDLVQCKTGLIITESVILPKTGWKSWFKS